MRHAWSQCPHRRDDVLADARIVLVMSSILFQLVDASVFVGNLFLLDL
jgi:hypothetical protein